MANQRLQTKILDTERLIHGFKTAIACILGFYIAHAFGVQGQWTVVSIIVVMCAEIYVGSILLKAMLRILGTILGCLFAILALISFGFDNTVVAITIGFSSFIFSYFVVSRENLNVLGTLGAATTAVIMLTPHPTVHIAIQRLLEICLGVVIATIISQFVLPIHARTHLLRIQAKTLQSLRDFFSVYVISDPIEADIATYEEADENIAKLLIKQRQLAKESRRELLGSIYDHVLFMHTLYCEKQILRAINFMYTALHEHQSIKVILRNSAELKKFNHTTLQAINNLIMIFNSEPMDTPVNLPSGVDLRKNLEKNLATLTEEEMIALDGFLFSAETLSHSLKKITALYTPLIT